MTKKQFSSFKGDLRAIGYRLGLGMLLCLSSECSFAEASKCSETRTIETLKDLKGANSPVLKIYEKMGVRTEVTIDAIRTLSSLPNGFLCEARLTLHFINLNELEIRKPGVTSDEGAELEKQLMETKSKKISEITYKVEVTDDGQDYVTIVPSEANIRQQEYPQEPHD